MIANINPAAHDFDETCNTLHYSAVAKDIQTVSRIDTNNRRNRVAAAPAAFSAAASEEAYNELLTYNEQLLDEIHQLRQKVRGEGGGEGGKRRRDQREGGEEAEGRRRASGTEKE